MPILKKRNLGYLFLIVIILLSGATGSRASNGPENLRYPIIQISKPLRFNLPGSLGTFREIEPVKIKVIVPKGLYRLQFSAGPFGYTGKECQGNYALETTYWIDKQENSFRPGQPLILPVANANLGKERYYELQLYGSVNIEKISAQPAGEYEGKISVLVTEGP